MIGNLSLRPWLTALWLALLAACAAVPGQAPSVVIADAHHSQGHVLAFAAAGDDSRDGEGTTPRMEEVGGVGNKPPRAAAAPGIPASRGTRVSYTSSGTAAGTLASGGSDGFVRLWRLPDGAPLGGFRAHDESVYGLAFVAHDRQLLSAGYDGRLALWSRDGRLARERQTPAPITAMAMHEGDGLVLTGHEDGRVRRWRLTDLAPVAEWALHRDYVRAVAIHAASGTFASSGADRQVYVWRAPHDSRDDARDGDRSGLLPSRGTTPSLEGGGTTSGTKDDRRDAGGRASLGTNAEVGGVGNKPPGAAAASDVPVSGVGLPGGGSRGTCASCTSPGAVADGGGTTPGMAEVGQRMERLPRATSGTVAEAPRALAPPPTDARTLAFTPDGRHLLGGGWFKLFRWDLGHGTLAVLPTEHGGIVAALDFGPDGHTLASISRQLDSAVLFLDPETGATRRRFQKHDLCGEHIALSRDGRWLATTADDGSVRIWDLLRGEKRP